MKNKKVKQMMVDIEKHYAGDLGRAWIAWVDGVCLVSGANFLWVNHRHKVSLTGDQLKAKD